MYKFFSLIFCSIFVYISAQTTSSFINKLENISVVIIRHGEEQSVGPNLNCQGWFRSQCIGNFFTNFDYIFGMRQKKSSTSCRGTNTLIPLSKNINIPIDICYAKGDEQQLVNKIMKMKNKNILICWQHANISIIARLLGGKNISFFPDMFDVIWTIKNGELSISKEPVYCTSQNNCNTTSIIPLCGSYISPIQCSLF